MTNRIVRYSIKNIKYSNPSDFFDSIDRGFMPSFLTGDGPKDISEESIIALHPVKRVKLHDLNSLWKDLRNLNNSINFHDKPHPINRIGAIGFISYEALHSIEKVKKQTVDHFSFPLAEWSIYSTYYYFNSKIKTAFKIIITYENMNIINGEHFKDSGFIVSSLKSDFTPEKYMENVEKIKNEIKNGEVYEVNLTQGILGNFSGSPYSLFKKLYKNNSAPYSAYLERDDFSIVSNSPELFLRASDKRIETRPIKGTAPRGKDSTEDENFKKQLYISKKNQAELFMIVDLMRNDLSKVCEIGSIKVVDKKRIEKYKNVFHLVSIIRGKLETDKDYIDLLMATFPGGSITGCPKIKCMELSEEIEKSSRNLYTGTIFIMNKKLLNSSIVIRSAVVKDDKIVLNSGGAITIDSDAKEEYNETIIKLKSIFKVVDCENYI